jgi:L-alanine-DL-glutamate epimerase-like enolase superfamily enzyme
MKPSRIRVSAFRIATSSPESDGTLDWNGTTLVTVEVGCGSVVGFGFTYADVPTAHFVCEHLADVALASEVMSPPAAFSRMEVAVRNMGREGVAATAIAAVDMALWDAKAKQLGCSLVDLLGGLRDGVDAYASGGFTSYSLDALRAQLARYAGEGFARVKMKIGDDGRTEDRVRAARDALGDRVHLFVDANGAFTPKHALEVAEEIVDYGVRWFEEPCSSDDVDGLRFVRERAPISMDIAAGEYGYGSRTFERLLAAGAVDVLQADATRCGVTGFMRVAASCEARGVPLSAHCAPTIHAQLGCAAPEMTHVEYFHDHARIEELLFDGAVPPRRGMLHPDRSRPGIGVDLKRADAERYRVFDGDVAARVWR